MDTVVAEEIIIVIMDTVVAETGITTIATMNTIVVLVIIAANAGMDVEVQLL